MAQIINMHFLFSLWSHGELNNCYNFPFQAGPDYVYWWFALWEFTSRRLVGIRQVKFEAVQGTETGSSATTTNLSFLSQGVVELAILPANRRPRPLTHLSLAL